MQWDLPRLRAAYETPEPVLIPLRELGALLEPEHLAALLAGGLRLYGALLPLEAEPVRAVEAHELVDACIDLVAREKGAELLADPATAPRLGALLARGRLH
ncbi:MAG: hypothetical protein OZ948_00400 [Deltaproteobacteria bacterium]|nr:hypothetical protein [Deltaproteobacteria bacterium]